MQIAKINNQKNLQKTSFNGFYNNKALIKGLEFASNNGAIFAATTTVILSTFIRPFAILATPNANAENKQYACAKSISSSLINLGIVGLITAPVVSAIKNIENNPQKFLNKNTIKNLTENSKTLKSSKPFLFSSQFFKLSSAFLTSVPKAFLTTILIAPIMTHFFGQENIKNNNSNNISFNGKIPNQTIYQNLTEQISKLFGKILDKKSMQNFVKKYKDAPLAQHIFSLNDIFLTGLFIGFTKKNKNIKENRKKTLIYNAGISTGLTVAGGYTISKFLDKPTEIFIKKFKMANPNLKNLEKYADGIKNAKASLILGGLYYILMPIVSTMLAEICTKDKL